MHLSLRSHLSRASVIGLLLVACAFVLTTQKVFADFVGQAVKVRGDVKITRDGTDLSVSTGTAFELGDIIKTGPNARLRIRFIDGSILTFAEKTTLSIDLFAIDATNKSRTVVLTMLNGIVNAAAAKSTENKFDYQIRTGSGYSAVRGTEWFVAVQNLVTRVLVISGLVEVGANASTGKPEMVGRGKWVSLDPQKGLGPVQTTTPDVLNPMLNATADTAASNTPVAVPDSTPALAPVPPVPSYKPSFVPIPDYSRTEGNNNNGNHNYSGHSDTDHGSSTN